jgi:hypothetical protein
VLLLTATADSLVWVPKLTRPAAILTEVSLMENALTLAAAWMVGAPATGTTDTARVAVVASRARVLV